jgi:hypothetical protein
MDNPAKCEHAPCSCPQSPLFGTYCCAECRKENEALRAGEESLTECRCSHADCGGVPEVSNEVQGLQIASEALANS